MWIVIISTLFLFALHKLKNFNNVKSLDFVFTQEEYAIAVCKGNTTLVDSLNEFIDKIRKDGTFDSIVGKYYA